MEHKWLSMQLRQYRSQVIYIYIYSHRSALKIRRKVLTATQMNFVLFFVELTFAERNLKSVFDKIACIKQTEWKHHHFSTTDHHFPQPSFEANPVFFFRELMAASKSINTVWNQTDD